MIFYEIELHYAHKLRFARHVEVSVYQNAFDRVPDFLELSLPTEGSVMYEYPDGEKELVEPGQFSPILSDLVCKMYAYPQKHQKHVTVITDITYSLTRHDSAHFSDLAALVLRVRDNGHLLIPYHMPLGQSLGAVTDKMQKIISLWASEKPSQRIEAIGAWYSLTALLTDLVLKTLDDSHMSHTPSTRRYADKAARYISDNLHTKLTTADIAASLGISEGHTERVFKAANGVGLMEYVNICRVKTAISLMENMHMSLKDAAHNVGIDDPSYMSRLFRHVTGFSCREYFKEQPTALKLGDLAHLSGGKKS